MKLHWDVVIAWRYYVINTVTAFSKITFLFPRREREINLCGGETSNPGLHQ